MHLGKKIVVLQMNSSKHPTQSGTNTSLRHLTPDSIASLHLSVSLSQSFTAEMEEKNAGALSSGLLQTDYFGEKETVSLASSTHVK